MTNLLEFIKLEDERKELQKQLDPLEKRRSEIISRQKHCTENLTYAEKRFLADKLWENMPPEEQEEVLAIRKKDDEEAARKREEEKLRVLNGGVGDDTFYQGTTYAISDYQKPFDPMRDLIEVFDYERKGTKVRFRVTCPRREGSISGMMRFLDVHTTVWIDIEELEDIRLN